MQESIAKLPDVEYGSLDLAETRKKYAFEREKRMTASKKFFGQGVEPASGRMERTQNMVHATIGYAGGYVSAVTASGQR